jgi:predicted transcriptional regulator
MKNVAIEVKILDLSDRTGKLYNDFHAGKKNVEEIKGDLKKIAEEINKFVEEI